MTVPRPLNTPGRTKTVFVVLAVGIIILGSVIVFQQFQLSALSSTISHQSSELAHPSSGLAILNFTVTKLNATSRPVMYLVLRNNGTTLIDSGGLLVGVYAQGNTFQSCYNNSQNFLPLYSNESVAILSPLTCGNLGDSVELTASAGFATYQGGGQTRLFNARTTIVRPSFLYPPTVVVKELGIQTVIIPEIGPGINGYTWYLTVTNDSPTAIARVNATAISPSGFATFDSGCAVTTGAFYGVSENTPLQPQFSCRDDNQISPSGLMLAFGESFKVAIAVTYVNQTTSSVFATAVVEPPYVLYQ